MNGNDLAAALEAELGLAQPDARKAVDAALAKMASAAARGEDISLNGFGKFKVKESAAREGRNPLTGEAMQIAASRKIGFTAAKGLKDQINA